MTWQDISVPIRSAMVTFEGDPVAHLERVSAMADGAICNVSRLDIGVHSGTHVDVPLHFIDGARDLGAFPLDLFVGPAWVADARRVDGHFDRAAIDALDIPPGTERLLILSRNSELWDSPVFERGFSAVTADGAALLVERGIRLVGLDYLSIAPFGDPVPTHVTLLGAGVAIVEGLDLRAVEPGDYDLICLPLRIPGSDGCPARAIVRRRS